MPEGKYDKTLESSENQIFPIQVKQLSWHVSEWDSHLNLYPILFKQIQILQIKQV
jgi:hypothetical protein